MRRRSTIIALALAPSLIALAACNKPEIKLPDNPIERAATCYAASISQTDADKGKITAEQANSAAQFIYLGAINDGLAEPSKIPVVIQKTEGLRESIEKAGNAKSYDSACAKAYPSTAKGSFKALPADDRSTRMVCFTLSTAALQVYESNHITPPDATAKMNAKLDVGLRDEINAEGKVNPAELAGFAMRSMAKAVEMGPMNDVLAACVKRYGAN